MSSPGLERNPVTGAFISGRGKRVVLSDEDLVRLVNNYIQTCRRPNGRVSKEDIRAKLGWNNQQWAQFNKTCGHLLNWDQIPKLSVLETPEVVDPQGVKASLEERGISTEAIANRIEVSFGQLRKDLYSIGLTRQEVDAAVAMQNFGENRFSNAMEMISSGVFATATKLQTRQREVEARLKEVRESIASYGGIASDERSVWVKEESDLTKQYVAIGKLLSEIQDTWYQGAAQLALVKMRMRDEGGGRMLSPTEMTQRANRPHFSPRVINQEPAENPDANQAPH
jgi:hypothetical protein